jgi:hypothetical protein
MKPMLKIVTDVGVGKAVEEYLQQQGHDVLAVRELDPDLPNHFSVYQNGRLRIRH